MRSTARWLGIALLLVLPACALSPGADRDGDGGASFDAGGAFVDAGVAPGVDGGATDASPPPSAEPEFDASRGGLAACFDGVDNDVGGGGADCDDRSCRRGVPACCVGRDGEGCCDDGVAEPLPFAGCDAGLGGCPALDGYSVFGAPSPRVEGGALLPGGQDAESGLLFPERLDPREGPIALTAEIATPAAPPTGGQIEVVGFGLVDADVDPGGLGRVSPVAGFRVSRNRAELAFVIAGETLLRERIETDTPVSYRLTVAPSGRIALSADGREVAAIDLPLAGGFRAVLYGRTANEPGESPPHTRVVGASVQRGACDMPDANARRDAPAIPAPGDPSWADAVDFIGEPDVLRFEHEEATQVVMAFSLGDAIYLARPGMGGFVPSTAVGMPALTEGVPGAPFAASGVRSPALRHDGEGGVEIWFVAENGDATSIARARPPASGHAYTDLEEVLPAEPGTRFESVDVFEVGGDLRFVAAVRDAEGTHLRVYRSNGDGWMATPVLSNRADALFAFDRDEVGDPSVAFEGGAYRLYFAGRRGTRWSIAVRASGDGLTFVEPPNSLVLEPSGHGFDALEVRGPSAAVLDGSLHLYYEGSDGSRSRVGVAIGPAP